MDGGSFSSRPNAHANALLPGLEPGEESANKIGANDALSHMNPLKPKHSHHATSALASIYSKSQLTMNIIIMTNSQIDQETNHRKRLK